jgi:hypothetical protein
VMAAMGFGLTVYPLRFVAALASSKLSELGLEGSYRYDVVNATVDAGTSSSTCRALDDELKGQLFYRYPLGGRLPKIGLGIGLANERTRFGCGDVPALSTTYSASEFMVKVLEPILGETLQIELSAGPRVLFSQRAKGYPTRAWALEGWITARPLSHIAVRLGARFTSTRLTTWPEGVDVLDNRTFVGLEAGAAL